MKKKKEKKRPPIAPVPTEKTIKISCENELVRFGIITDTHICSKYQQITFLKHFYELCFKKKIQTVLHAGDVTDGNGRIYSGHFYELFLHSYDEQVEYVVRNYPKQSGINTYMLGGN